MTLRVLGCMAGFLLASAASAVPQQAPAGRAGSIERDLQGLSAPEFADRQAAVKRLEALIADQVKQRAQIQEILNTLQNELARQQQALLMVTDEEAKSRVAGLLELERGLSGWTIQVMSEPPERRRALLAWGLSPEAGPILAKAYAHGRRTRLEGIRQLAKLDAPGAAWTLAELINDPDGAIRASAMAAAWTARPNPDIVGALWHRAVSGPLVLSERGGVTRMSLGIDDEEAFSLKVDFPESDPLHFPLDDDAGEYLDALLAGSVLVHLKSPLVEERIRRLVADRASAGKSLALPDDLDWTLVTHRLVEAYNIKEALPLLAAEALSEETEELAGSVNGRAFAYSPRTIAIGVLCKLIGKDPGDFQLLRVRDPDLHGWMWALDQDPQNALFNGGNGDPPDGPPVRAFYKWWKEHHKQYGILEEPPAAGVPPEPRPGRGRGNRGGGGGGGGGGRRGAVEPQIEPDTPDEPGDAGRG